MMKVHRRSVSALGLLASAILFAGSATAQTDGLPGCREASTPFMTMGVAGKDFFAPYNGAPYGDYFATFGLKNLSRQGEMVMESAGSLYYSPDEGCTWDLFYTLDGSEPWPLWITVAPGGHAYAFSLNNSTLLALRNIGGGMEATSLKSPVMEIMGLGVDPTDPLHVRIGDKGGQMHESFDGGVVWNKVGVPAQVNGYANRMTFNEADFDHVMYMANRDGAFVTFDGGATWAPSEGLTSTDGPRNAFNAVFSPVDSDLVWCMSIDLDEADGGHPSGGKHLYASRDGGLSFEPRVDNGNGIVITNGPELTAHPRDRRKVAWVASNRYTGLDVYELNGVTGVVSISHNDFLAGRCIEYYLPNPALMYIGLETKF
ncbi:MAG: hypothetical protein HND57_03890 [Planctomycetes bacterium]|nr:hypothetical protein [Planctomycetota bacterium]